MGWTALAALTRALASARRRPFPVAVAVSAWQGRPRATAVGTKAHLLPGRLLATSWRCTRRPTLPPTLLPAARHQPQVVKERLQQQPRPPRPPRRYVPAAAEASRASPEAWAPPPCLLAAPLSSASRSRFARTVPLVWPLAGSECGGVCGDARDVHGRCARTLGCACMRRSSVHAASHGSSHPPAHACFDASLACACGHLATL